MMKWITFIIAGLAGLIGIFTAGRKSGTEKERSAIIKKGVEDAKETKIRRNKALQNSDSSNIDDVVKRMRKYTTD